MCFYFVAQIRINDEKEYQKYLENAQDIFEMYKGQYIAVDNNPLILEGMWNYSRIVLIRFEEKKDFDAWYFSEEYQYILKYRLNAACCDSILVTGLTE